MIELIEEVKGLLQVVSHDVRPCLVDDYLRTCEDQVPMMNTPIWYTSDRWNMKRIWGSQITSEAFDFFCSCEVTCRKFLAPKISCRIQSNSFLSATIAISSGAMLLNDVQFTLSG